MLAASVAVAIYLNGQRRFVVVLMEEHAPRVVICSLIQAMELMGDQDQMKDTQTTEC